MKKKHIIISCVLVVGIVICGLALADSQRTGQRRDFGFKRLHTGGDLQLLAEYQQKNLRVQVLSEMTGQSVESIQLKLKDYGMRSAMQELNIDRQAFRAAVHAKEQTLIKQAVVDGSITPEQQKEILAKIENRTKRRELMGKLIEKGIEDGTITREEARMLLHKRR
jgi:polyhydroxyalkanoate synthesis regulator phasin